MKFNLVQKIVFALFLGVLGYWLWLRSTGMTSGYYNYLFSLIMNIVPVFGGLVAMIGSRYWNGLKSFTGKGIFFLGLGVFFFGCGGLVWSYYNFVIGTAAPYPSLADLGYAPSVFFYALGAVYLCRAAGADLGLQRKYAPLFLAFVPTIMLAISYYLLVVVARDGVLLTAGESILKQILDIAYPLGDFLSLTVSIVISGLSFTYLAPKYRAGIFAILGGLVVMYCADMIFSYTTTRGTYFNGDFGDMLFIVGMFLLSFGALGFLSKSEQDMLAA